MSPSEGHIKNRKVQCKSSLGKREYTSHGENSNALERISPHLRYNVYV